MRLIDRSTRTITTLALALGLLTLASAAFAHGHGRGHAYGHRGYYRVACAPRPVYYAAPACEPRSVVYRPSRVLIVRPTPYVTVGTRIGPVDISAIFGPNRYASRYEYGCNFCDAHFRSFDGYENHVEQCEHRPSNVHLEVHAWGDNGYGQVAYDD